MKKTQLIMGMPITIDVADSHITAKDLEQVFTYFKHVDAIFSTYKQTSEISRLNEGELPYSKLSPEVKLILKLAEDTKIDTHGYFDITTSDGNIDPSGVVKGWAIYNAAKLLKKNNYRNFFIDAGGDIQVSGKNHNGKLWRIGIGSPFNLRETIKVLRVEDKGVATSGTYIRGQHIYNPYRRKQTLNDIVSITIIGPTVYDADRFATAAFAMGRKGVSFIQSLEGFEAYMIDKNGKATFTTGFEHYTL